MVNVQQSPQDGWLQSDNTVLISALAAITVATSSFLLWCCHRSVLLQDTAHSPAASKVTPEEVRDVTRQRSEQCTQGKASRSKERRRRGKDPFKEFSKVGKKHKELLRQLNRASTASNGVSTTATSERECPRPENFTCETDKSPSVQISNSNSSRLGVFASNQRPTTYSSPAPSSNMSLGETANPLSVDKSYPEAEVNEEPEDQYLSSQPTKRVLSDTSPVFGEPYASSTDPSSRGSPSDLPAHPLGSSTLTEVPCSTSNTPSTRKSHGKSHSRVASPWDWDGQSSFYHEPPPHFAGARVVNPQRESSSPIFPPVTFSPPDTPSTLSRILSSSSIESSARCDAASPPPASRVGDQLPPIPCLPPPVSVSAQTEIASLRGALEAVRLRETKSRAEAERRAKDYDALSWRWTEERTRWYRREAELYAQIQHLTLALQMYAGSRPFSSATVPISPAFVSSLPCAVPSTMTHRLCSPALDSTRGRCRQRIQDNGEGNTNTDSDVFPFNDKVAGAILKRPESLRTGTRRNSAPPNEVGPLRFPSLSDLGNVWPSREAEVETPSRGFRYGASAGICEDGKATEGAEE